MSRGAQRDPVTVERANTVRTDATGAAHVTYKVGDLLKQAGGAIAKLPGDSWLRDAKPSNALVIERITVKPVQPITGVNAAIVGGDGIARVAATNGTKDLVAEGVPIVHAVSRSDADPTTDFDVVPPQQQKQTQLELPMPFLPGEGKNVFRSLNVSPAHGAATSSCLRAMAAMLFGRDAADLCPLAGPCARDGTRMRDTLARYASKLLPLAFDYDGSRRAVGGSIFVDPPRGSVYLTAHMWSHAMGLIRAALRTASRYPSDADFFDDAFVQLGPHHGVPVYGHPARTDDAQPEERTMYLLCNPPAHTKAVDAPKGDTSNAATPFDPMGFTAATMMRCDNGLVVGATMPACTLLSRSASEMLDLTGDARDAWMREHANAADVLARLGVPMRTRMISLCTWFEVEGDGENKTARPTLVYPISQLEMPSSMDFATHPAPEEMPLPAGQPKSDRRVELHLTPRYATVLNQLILDERDAQQQSSSTQAVTRMAFLRFLWGVVVPELVRQLDPPVQPPEASIDIHVFGMPNTDVKLDVVVGMRADNPEQTVVCALDVAAAFAEAGEALVTLCAESPEFANYAKYVGATQATFNGHQAGAVMAPDQHVDESARARALAAERANIIALGAASVRADPSDSAEASAERARRETERGRGLDAFVRATRAPESVAYAM